MTTISSGAGIGATAGLPTGDGALSALGGMGSGGFLELMVAQLRYQNPMAPSDPSAMMMQTAQLAQLDAIQQLASLQRRDLGLQNAVAAAGLVGTTVNALATDGGTVQGVVDAVRYTTLGPVLDIGGQEVPFDHVTEIRKPDAPITDA
ncbi:flagellar hook assembly protein FlgD [Egicoccus sp. AB-alg6-2]|uniref:flagellar hook assembly protein FlgD n=1 Tax=Egicoccus sp. AB-alg6-2 TaxID=3242692 RepID=UPI00359D1490